MRAKRYKQERESSNYPYWQTIYFYISIYKSYIYLVKFINLILLNLLLAYYFNTIVSRITFQFHFYSLSLCVCVVYVVCMQVYVPLCINMQRPQQGIGCLHYHLQHYCFEIEYLTHLILDEMVDTKLQGAACFCPLMLTLQACAIMSSLICGCWEFELSLHAHTAGALTH